jgi:deazaflavin-dependent oxidoreductase (nitroreductase family)
MTPNEQIPAALQRGGTIDITTTGRKSGELRRIEITFFNFDGRVYISGLPGKRSWIANLASDPHFTFHLKKGFTTDLSARARIISSETERRSILERICVTWNRVAQTGAFVARAPLIEVTFDDASLLAA